MKKTILSISLLLLALAFCNTVLAQVAVSVRVGAPAYCPPGKLIVVKPAPVVAVPPRPIVVVPARPVVVVHPAPRPVPPPVYVRQATRRVVVVR